MVKDPIGRNAIGVIVNYPKRTAAGRQGKQEIFLDPKTYAYLGESQHAAPVEPPAYKGKKMPTATYDDGLIVSARAAWGVVDKPGARP